MLISEFDYDLPPELIAQEPAKKRDASRMLLVNRQNQSWSDSTFSEFPLQLNTADIVVVNNTKVFPARLVGRRAETGGRVEVFLVKRIGEDLWEALLKPGGRLRRGSIVIFGDERLTAEILDEPGPEMRKVKFQYDGSFDQLLQERGSTPLPPYIKRAPGVSDHDRERYQTVYSKSQGAIAAPTAGLHFTPEVLTAVTGRAALAEITLHVGYGTFEPVRVDDISQHQVSGEQYDISESAAELINKAKNNGGRVIAVGTTTLRTLESAVKDEGQLESGQGETKLTIKPGYKFRIVDVLLTNFHLPRSSLLLLVSAFAGKELVLAAYRHAVAEHYRFYSYGDCMLIL